MPYNRKLPTAVKSFRKQAPPMPYERCAVVYIQSVGGGDPANKVQFAACQEWCDRHGMPVGMRFEQKGRSAVLFVNREKFHRAVAVASAWNCPLVVYSLRTAVSGMRELDRALPFLTGGLVAVADKYVDTTQGYRDVVETLLRCGAELGVGKAKKARANRKYHDRMLGWRNGRIVHEEQEIRRGIYRMYTAGRKLREIVEWLNGRGLKTVRGKEWTFLSVYAILNGRFPVLNKGESPLEYQWKTQRPSRKQSDTLSGSESASTSTAQL